MTLSPDMDPHGRQDVPDPRLEREALALEAVELVRGWVRESAGHRPDASAAQLAAALRDPDGLGFVVGFVDGVVRPQDTRVAAAAPEPMVRCTSSTNRPTPCCSCTTKSPARSCSGSTTLRRRLGMRRMSRVEDPARPVRSDSENTARRCASATNPGPTGAGVTRTTPPAGSSSIVATSRAGQSAAFSCSTMRCAGP